MDNLKGTINDLFLLDQSWLNWLIKINKGNMDTKFRGAPMGEGTEQKYPTRLNEIIAF